MILTGCWNSLNYWTFIGMVISLVASPRYFFFIQLNFNLYFVNSMYIIKTPPHPRTLYSRWKWNHWLTPPPLLMDKSLHIGLRHFQVQPHICIYYISCGISCVHRRNITATRRDTKWWKTIIYIFVLSIYQHTHNICNGVMHHPLFNGFAEGRSIYTILYSCGHFEVLTLVWARITRSRHIGVIPQ